MIENIKQIGPVIPTSIAFGAMAYISLIDSNSRKKLDQKSVLSHWKRMFSITFPMMSGLVAGSTAIALISSRHWQQYYHSILLGSLFPYTLLILSPVYKKILKPTEKEQQCSKMLTELWVTGHNWRTICCGVALALFIWSKRN